MSLEKVRKYFKQFGMDDKIIEFDGSSATVKDAAERLNCKEELIAKTLGFIVKDEVILIVLRGDAKIDNSKYKAQFNTKAKMVNFDEVEELVGHKVGGVCPFAINDGIEVYLDESLKEFEYVYPACGSANSAIKLTISELEKYSKFEKWIDVSKIIEKD